MLNNITQHTVNQRVNFLIEYFEAGNKSAFGRRVDMKSGVIGDMVGGRMNKPSYDAILKILLAYPTVSADWLILGREPMLRGSIDSNREYSGQIGRFPVLSPKGNEIVPLLTAQKLKYYFMRHETQSEPSQVMYYEKEAIESLAISDSLIGKGEFVAFPVMNNMMEPTLKLNDFVVAKKIENNDWTELSSQRIYVIFSTSHSFLMCRVLYYLDGKTISCIFDNSSWSNIKLNRIDIHEIWEFKMLLSTNDKNLFNLININRKKNDV